MIRVNLLQTRARPPRLQQIDIKSTFGTDSPHVPIAPYLAIRALAVKEEELNRYKRSLEHVNSELVRTNHALSILACRIKEGRQELMKEIAVTIASRILPAIDEIAQCRRPESLMLQLDVVRVLVKGLLPDSMESASIIPVLSRGEMRVAIMIKNDLKTSDIARLLYVSEDTVKTHRRNIRKKLGIRNCGTNLSSALKLKMGNTSDCFYDAG
jgi:ATP/maltotriose-dependent transcriptional regulator MalT